MCSRTDRCLVTNSVQFLCGSEGIHEISMMGHTIPKPLDPKPAKLKQKSYQVLIAGTEILQVLNPEGSDHLQPIWHLADRRFPPKPVPESGPTMHGLSAFAVAGVDLSTKETACRTEVTQSNWW